MSNNDTIDSNLTTNDDDTSISHANHNIVLTVLEVVTAELDTTLDSAEEISTAPLLEPTTKNGLLI